MKFLKLALLLASTGLVGCTSPIDMPIGETSGLDYNEVVGTSIFKIEPTTVSCEGYHPKQKCYVVNGETFYDHIEGFVPIPGKVSTVRVQKIKQFSDDDYKNVSDVGQFYYKVIEVLKTEPL